MARVHLAPSAIYFSQDSISNSFGNYTPHRNKTIGETLDDILLGKCEISDLPTISVIKKNGFWVSADNRRLWVFKKLEEFGKCNTVPADITQYLKPSKDCIRSSIRVRGQEGGTFWRTWGRMKKTEFCVSSRENSNLQTEIESYTLQSGASVDSKPVSNSTLKQTSKETSLMMSSFADFSVGRIQAFRNVDIEHRPKTSTSSSAEHTATDRYRIENSRMRSAREREMPSNHTISTSYIRQTSSAGVLRKTQVSHTRNREYFSIRTQPSNPENKQPSSIEFYSREDDNHSIESEKQSSDINVSKVNQPPSYPQTVVNLNPLDVGFAGLLGSSTFDGEQIGECLDRYLSMALDRSITFRLKVFYCDGKYYSEKRRNLWIIQSLQRLSGNIKISGRIVPRPAMCWRLCDTLLSFSKVKGKHWKNKRMLNNLPTKKVKPLTLTEILYSSESISDAFKGRSIIREVMQVYSSGRRNHELNVVEYNSKFYALQNEKLWVLKQVEVVLGPLKINGNVKVCMDDIMFHSFASDNIRSVDIIMTGIEHTEEEKFMLEYIKKMRKF